MKFCIKTDIFCKHTWDLRGSPHCTHNHLKGSSPGPCALCVRRENLTHKVISVKIFTLSLYGSLSRDANFGFFLDRFCGFWKLSQFPRMQKILWNNIHSFERHASMFWKYFDWSQLFFCEKSMHILCLQQVGKVNILFCSICSKCPIKMFPDVFFFWRVGSPVTKLNSLCCWFFFPRFPNPRV